MSVSSGPSPAQPESSPVSQQFSGFSNLNLATGAPEKKKDDAWSKGSKLFDLDHLKTATDMRKDVDLGGVRAKTNGQNGSNLLYTSGGDY